ncbi:hypothetical protein N9S20_03430, partial [Candidatus Pelagibacter sp.]|nr:hypothetical protein [Candidatus Pelagibacter sp.]
MLDINRIKTIVITIFVLLIFTQSKSEIKIAVVEMDKVMRESLAGKSLIEQLAKIDNSNKKFFNESKKSLAIKKKKILSQKNILADDEFNKKIISLNKEFEKYQNEAKKRINLVQSKRDLGMKKIFDDLKV